MRVDSELATKTNTSASKQNLSIQLSSSVVTSVPGLSRTKTTNSYLHGKEIVHFYKLIKIEWKHLRALQEVTGVAILRLMPTSNLR